MAKKEFWLRVASSSLGIISWFLGFEIIMQKLIKTPFYNFISITATIFIGVILIAYSLSD